MEDHLLRVAGVLLPSRPICDNCLATRAGLALDEVATARESLAALLKLDQAVGVCATCSTIEVVVSIGKRRAS